VITGGAGADNLSGGGGNDHDLGLGGKRPDGGRRRQRHLRSRAAGDVVNEAASAGTMSATTLASYHARRQRREPALYRSRHFTGNRNTLAKTCSLACRQRTLDGGTAPIR